VFGHFVQTQLQIVVRPDPFGCIDGSFFQSLVDFTGGQVLGHATQALDDLAGKAADAEFGALELGQRLERLAEPTAHLGTSIAHGEIDDVVTTVEVAQQLHAIAFKHPRIHLALVQAEWNGTAQGEGFVLAKEIIRGGIGHVDGTVLDRIDHTESRHDFSGCMGADLDLATGQFLDFGSKNFGATEQGVQRFGEAGSQAKTQNLLSLDSGCDTGGQNASNTGMLKS